MKQAFRSIWDGVPAVLIVVGLILGFSGARANVPPSHYTVVQATLDQYVVPHFQALDEAVKTLPEAVTQVCKSGSADDRAALNKAFSNVVRAWAGVDYLRFGPMLEAARRERMSFWPDPRNVMKRQLRQILLAADDKILDSDISGIAKQSAAVQGLPALEVLLADTETPLGPEAAARYRCKFAFAITQNIKTISADLYRDWTKDGGWRDKMLRPGSDNETYKEPQEAASELVKAFLTGLALVGDGEVKPRLDPNAKFSPPYEKLSAGHDYFIAGVASLKAFYAALDLEAFLEPDKQWVKSWVGGAWQTLAMSDGAGGLAPGVKTGEAPLLRKVLGMFVGLRKVTISVLAPAAGLTIGFNELDGD